MAELKDYSGSFNAALRYDDFHRELLLKALKAYADYIRILDGTWYLSVKRKMNDDIAFECDRSVWHRMEVHDVEVTRKLFNIPGHNVAAMLKCLQVSPWAWTLEHRVHLRDENHGIWTVNRCPTLLALEREGEGREEKICRLIETELLQIRAHAINPKMKATPLRLPPRKSPDEVACQWEFRIET